VVAQHPGSAAGAFSYRHVADLLIWWSVKSVLTCWHCRLKESHNFNCITFLVTQLQFFSHNKKYGYYTLVSYSYIYSKLIQIFQLLVHFSYSYY